MTTPNLYIDLSDSSKVVARRLDTTTFIVTKTRGHETRQQKYSEEAFFVSFKPVTEEPVTCDFSTALKCLKEGKRIYRTNWNGNNQWVILINPGNAMHVSSAGSFDMQKCFGLKNTQGNMQPGWIPSIGDLLAEDWIVKD